jgi:hypothetical protein
MEGQVRSASTSKAGTLPYDLYYDGTDTINLSVFDTYLELQDIDDKL